MNYQIPDGFVIRPGACGIGYDVLETTTSPSCYATINWKRRCFYSGFSTRHQPITNTEHKKRGWQQSLINEACTWLRNLTR
jgi:hypothetical protein